MCDSIAVEYFILTFIQRHPFIQIARRYNVNGFRMIMIKFFCHSVYIFWWKIKQSSKIASWKHTWLHFVKINLLTKLEWSARLFCHILIQNVKSFNLVSIKATDEHKLLHIKKSFFFIHRIKVLMTSSLLTSTYLSFFIFFPHRCIWKWKSKLYFYGIKFMRCYFGRDAKENKNTKKNQI